jgi:hypothetical protein
MTKAIQLLVSCLAKAEGMSQGLKVVSKIDTILYNSTWMAGVDYNQNNQVNEDQESQVNHDNEYKKMHADIIVRLAQDKHQANLHQDQEKQLLGTRTFD